LKEISDGRYSINLKESPIVNLLGSDLILERVDSTYGILFGVLKRSTHQDTKLFINYLDKIGLNNVELGSTSLFKLLIESSRHKGYLVREYRAGTHLLQSYFKDDTVEGPHRLVLKRLKTDWNDGIKPYYATLKSQTESTTLSLSREGLILMSKVPSNMTIVNDICGMMIRDHRIVLNRVKAIKIITVNPPEWPVTLHGDLIIELNKGYEGAGVTKLASAEEKLLNYLGETAGIYGKDRNDSSFSFNLVYSRFRRNEKIEITSALSIDITAKKIVIYPNSPPDANDLIHLYYGIDRYFKFDSS
jgi:hypothetical protein